ncbi:MAG: hypothetical protein K6B45_09300 [Bacteroidaceae bacterium]|nr:hypothetical protein [Bacteroidaceae bacterium]
MKLQATIKTISALREGVSFRTGNPYKTFDTLIEWPDGEHRQRQTALVAGEHAERFMAQAIRPGDSVVADLQLTTDSWNGKLFNRAILRNIVKCPPTD